MKRIAFLFLNIYTKKPLQKPKKQNTYNKNASKPLPIVL